MTQTPEIPNTVNELLEMNKQDDEPNMELLFSELNKLNPKETAFVVKGLVEKVERFHEFVVEKRMRDGVNDENISELGLWILDMKSWRMILQEIHNISDFSDDDE